ncbi:MAG TPA: hypothetical protein VE086_06585, partial [Chthoniobacterales bacterium]|nr:hypothetical protein [Chthoniobacterales bacterium]
RPTDSLTDRRFELSVLLTEVVRLAFALPILLFVPRQNRFLFGVRVVVKERSLFGRARRESAEKREHSEF